MISQEQVLEQEQKQEQNWRAQRPAGISPEDLPAWCTILGESIVESAKFVRYDRAPEVPARKTSRGGPGPSVEADEADMVQADPLPEAQAEIGAQVEARLEEAHERGFEEGLEAGLKEGRQAERLDGWISGTSAIASLLSMLRREASEVLGELAVCVAKAILKREIDRDDEFILNNIKACLDGRVPNGPVKLRIQPEVLRRIERSSPAPEWLLEAGGAPAVQLVGDQAMGPGDCILESGKIRIDARVQSQLDQLREVLVTASSSSLSVEEA